jgi:hypothetical protein
MKTLIHESQVLFLGDRQFPLVPGSYICFPQAKRRLTASQTPALNPLRT